MQALQVQAKQFGDVLAERDKIISAHVDTLNPTTLKYQDQIAELRADDDYKGFSNEQLAVIAAKQANGEDVTKRAPGAPGGRRATVAKKSIPVTETAEFKLMYPEHHAYLQAQKATKGAA